LATKALFRHAASTALGVPVPVANDWGRALNRLNNGPLKPESNMFCGFHSGFHKIMVSNCFYIG
jgi:hypothetical protein